VNVTFTACPTSCRFAKRFSTVNASSGSPPNCQPRWPFVRRTRMKPRAQTAGMSRARPGSLTGRRPPMIWRYSSSVIR